MGARRFVSAEILVLLVALGLGGSSAAAPLVTRWGAALCPTNVWPEYPRPQLVREQWQNLNGIWECAISGEGSRPPSEFTNRILVPFPLESHLSGVAGTLDERSTLWYRWRFTVPAEWRDREVLLHFGAVDWSASVFVNGRHLGVHRGGYDSFTFEITPAIQWEGANELIVAVTDPTEGDQPRGKQARKPEGIFYTPSSGIWQTVWLEAVPPTRITGVKLAPDWANGSLRAWVMANTLEADVRAEVLVRFAGEAAGRGSAVAGAGVVVPLSVIRPWSPATPSLYDVEITLRRGDEVLDRVRSYFGLREIRLGTDENGNRRLFLNGQAWFQIGVLDQGFWPDGLYTAPSDEALRFDLETARQLGFNLVRKHVKVEPERWYYWADRLGLLVWQDMPSGNNSTEAGRRQFEMELQRMVEQRGNHPCIVMWVLFNEGWGQSQTETERLVRRIKLADPTRLVDNASGWTDQKVGDVIDLHSYPAPLAPASEPVRAGVLGEFGGLSLGIDHHTWSQKTWGYQAMTDSERLMAQYGLLLEKVWELERTRGLAAAVYTQLTDVETECNGFLTYDRAVLKVEAAEVRRANRNTPLLLPTAKQGAFTWSYQTNQPPPGWMEPDYNAAEWPTGVGGFGTSGSPGVIVGTTWDSADIWLRREFELAEGFSPPSGLLLHHDEDAEVYLNGTLAAKTTGFTVGYRHFPLLPEGMRALRSGRNVIAVHCHQTSGGQYIDVGLLAGE